MDTTPSGAYVRRGLQSVRFPGESSVPARVGGYELLHRIGSGGMGEVFLVSAPLSSGRRRPLALKRLLPELADDPDMCIRFADEARLATKLRHANLVSAVDVSRAHHDRFFTMEFVDGRTLADVVRESARLGIEIPLAATLQLVLDIASALEHAHDLRGANGRSLEVVHCDVSPTNILVSGRGDVRLVDFGIARGRHTTLGPRDDGRVLGTLGYMSPEQCRGEDIDHRSDIFSLGVLLWELTTFTRLFRGDRDEVVARISSGEIPLPSDVQPGYPRDLEDVVLRALRYDPAHRFDSARRFSDVLQRFACRRGVGDGRAELVRLGRRLEAAALRPPR